MAQSPEQGPHGGYGPPPELQRAQADTTAALERVTRQSYQTLDTAAATNRALQKQDEQLCAADHTLDEVDYELRRSERHVRATARWRGVFANWFTRTPRPPARGPATTAELNNRTGAAAASPVEVAETQDEPARQQQQRQRAAPSGPAPAAAANDPAWSERDARLLGELHGNVLRMRDQAALQNDMLARQNEALDNLAAKTAAAEDRVDRNHQNVRRLL